MCSLDFFSAVIVDCDIWPVFCDVNCSKRLEIVCHSFLNPLLKAHILARSRPFFGLCLISRSGFLIWSSSPTISSQYTAWGSKRSWQLLAHHYGLIKSGLVDTADRFVASDWTKLELWVTKMLVMIVIIKIIYSLAAIIDPVRAIRDYHAHRLLKQMWWRVDPWVEIFCGPQN